VKTSRVNGKLLLRSRWLQRIRNSAGFPSGDVYHGDRATGYDAERAGTAFWENEQSAVEGFLGQLEPGNTVLDVPIGTGRFLELYGSRGLQVTGMDRSSDIMSVAASKAFPLVDLVKGDATKPLPFAANSFDAVVVFRFLQYVVNNRAAKRFIREAARVSKKWVVLELDVSPHEGAANSRHTMLPWQPLANRSGEKEIKALLSSSGLVLDSVSGPLDPVGLAHFAFVCRKQ